MDHVTEKVFIADDKFVDVIRVLERRGWTRSRHAKSPNFHLKWRNLSNINFRMLREDQFVNHVFNSQQLSNKALLVDHLAFQHHIIQHQSHGSFLPEPNADSLCLTPNGDRINGCGDLVEKIDIDSTVDPEAFFPRCFNMEGGAVSALVDAFVVSASVALLRKSLEAEDEPRLDVIPRDASSVDVLRAATSVISRYVSLHKYATSTQHTPESTPRRSARTTEPTRAGIFDRDSGVAFSTEDPDCFAVLSAWEAAVAPETDFDSDIMPLIRRAEKGCSARAHQDPPVDATAGSRKTTDGGSRLFHRRSELAKRH
ncbi:unnamed protein product [Ascophyllum nodosum]